MRRALARHINEADEPLTDEPRPLFSYRSRGDPRTRLEVMKPSPGATAVVTTVIAGVPAHMPAR